MGSLPDLFNVAPEPPSLLPPKGWFCKASYPPLVPGTSASTNSLKTSHVPKTCVATGFLARRGRCSYLLPPSEHVADQQSRATGQQGHLEPLQILVTHASAERQRD